LETKLDQIKGLGPKTIYKLRQANIWSTYDLILHVPKSYKDFSISNPSELKHESRVTLHALVTSPLMNNPYGKVFSTSFDIKVFDQVIKVIIFNRKYLSKQIKEGQMIIVQGVYHLYRQQLLATEIKLNVDDNQSIQPLYKIKDVSDYVISKAIVSIFQDEKVQIFEIIPEEFIKRYKLVSRVKAYRNLHMPKSFSDIEQAVRRLKYEEAFFLELKVISDQSIFIKRKPKTYDINNIKSFIQTIPYELTFDQKQAVNDIYRDFKKDHAMFRLIQGDVGSGKTVVALIAIMAVVSMHEQAVFMAPTNLLANQQYETYKKLAPKLNIGLLTQKTPNKTQMIKDIKSHQYDLIIGTHALIEDYVAFSNLGLVVIDEQHKFGVDTRNQLIDKSHSKDVLYLTATPIPRTLAMMTFGQQNVSIIKEKPQQKAPIDTQYVTKDKLSVIFNHIHKEIKLNHHVYVVVPAITSDKVDDNIESIYELLIQKLDIDIFMIHGQMKKQQQEDTMQKFKDNPSVLLATTMIEVGIDIPTATTMVIFSAEFFGLSQLHQLRGRVGRSGLASTCYLVSEKSDIDRLKLLSRIDDGFELANYDLKIRGPGDFLGKEQSGYLKFHFLDIMQDQKIINIAQKDVLNLLKQKDFKTNHKYKYLNRYIKETIKI